MSDFANVSDSTLYATYKDEIDKRYKNDPRKRALATAILDKKLKSPSTVKDSKDRLEMLATYGYYKNGYDKLTPELQRALPTNLKPKTKTNKQKIEHLTNEAKLNILSGKGSAQDSSIVETDRWLRSKGESSESSEPSGQSVIADDMKNQSFNIEQLTKLKKSTKDRKTKKKIDEMIELYRKGKIENINKMYELLLKDKQETNPLGLEE